MSNKETLSVKIARLETKVDSIISDKLTIFIELNKEEHKEIIDSIKDLKIHVNEELQAFDKRVKACEDLDKTEAIIYKSTIIVLSVLATVVGILGHFKLI